MWNWHSLELSSSGGADGENVAWVFEWSTELIKGVVSSWLELLGDACNFFNFSKQKNINELNEYYISTKNPNLFWSLDTTKYKNQYMLSHKANFNKEWHMASPRAKTFRLQIEHTQFFVTTNSVRR